MAPAAVAAVEEEGSRRPRFEVADIFRLYGEAYRRSHRLPADHRHVMADIENCRTPALGGHLERCTSCGFERPTYESCRNRHCPKCQSLAKSRWLAARQAELLPVAYFHGVFTLPHEVNPVVLANLKALVGLLFHAVSQTLLTFGRNELGGTLGILAVLHTWDQLLRDHFHLHCLIPGGVLATGSDEKERGEEAAEGPRAGNLFRWVPSSPNSLFDIDCLARVFRGKFLDGFKKLYAQGKLVFPPAIAPLGTPSGFQSLIDALYDKDWVVFCKPPVTGPEKVIDYLARYTYRVAISNHRLLDVGDDHVSFSYRDRAHGDVVRTARLPAAEFIRRFLLHVLPTSLQRIRHYGLLANRTKKAALPVCRRLLGASPPPACVPAKTLRDEVLALTGVDIHRCPSCGNPTLTRVGTLAPARGSTPIRAPP